MTVSRKGRALGPTDGIDMPTDRKRLHELLDSLPDDRLALADTALTALAMPGAESVVDSDREALAAVEQDPEKIGNALAGYRGRQGWIHDDLAEFPGLTLGQLAALSGERRPFIRSKQGTWSPGSGIYALAEAHGADGHRLFEAVEHRSAATRPQATRSFRAPRAARLQTDAGQSPACTHMTGSPGGRLQQPDGRSI
jgi:hypothetical protein